MGNDHVEMFNFSKYSNTRLLLHTVHRYSCLLRQNSQITQQSNVLDKTFLKKYFMQTFSNVICIRL